VAKFHRTSPHRLAFLLQSVFELREGYRRSGGDLLIGYGRPEVLLPSLIKRLQEQGEVAGVWAQREYTLEETRTLDKVAEALPQGVDVHYNDSKTLLPAKHLPFDPKKQTPDVYTAFRKKVEGMGLNLGEGMLVEPAETAKWETKGNGVQGVVVSVGKEGTKLKPYPKVELGADHGSGWIDAGSDVDSAEGLYAKLAKPLFDNPPLGGWSSAVKEGQLPKPHPTSAIPFAGGETSALSRLEDYVGHATGSGWEGGKKAKTYKDTRNGLMGEDFSTKFASFLALGTLSAKEAGWRVGELLERVGKDAKTRGNVYCMLFRRSQVRG
jgi:deoxyribodipyrimidine photo-lyase